MGLFRGRRDDDICRSPRIYQQPCCESIDSRARHVFFTLFRQHILVCSDPGHPKPWPTGARSTHRAVGHALRPAHRAPRRTASSSSEQSPSKVGVPLSSEHKVTSSYRSTASQFIHGLVPRMQHLLGGHKAIPQGEYRVSLSNFLFLPLNGCPPRGIGRPPGPKRCHHLM